MCSELFFIEVFSLCSIKKMPEHIILLMCLHLEILFMCVNRKDTSELQES